MREVVWGREKPGKFSEFGAFFSLRNVAINFQLFEFFREFAKAGFCPR